MKISMDNSMLLEERMSPPVDSTEISSTRSSRPRSSSSWTFVAVLVHLLLIGSVSAVRQNHYVHWNTSNPIFRIDNTDHIVDVNRGNQPWEYDQVNIICPVYRPGTRETDTEQYIIYNVSKEEYETCRITDPDPRVIAVCNKPYELIYFTITFRSFTPTPGGMEFKPGRDYYFISTSSKGDLHRRAGGHCSSHNMKVAFKVADNEHETPPRVINAPRRTTEGPPPPPPYQKTTPFSSWVPPLPPRPTPKHVPSYDFDRRGYYPSPGHGVIEIETLLNNHLSNKKSEEYSNVHPNDVVKHEASRMASGADRIGLGVTALFVAVLVILIR